MTIIYFALWVFICSLVMLTKENIEAKQRKRALMAKRNRRPRYVLEAFGSIDD